MKLTLADLQFVTEEGRRRFVELDGSAALPGCTKPMTESERRAFCLLMACATVYRRHGLISEEAIDGTNVEIHYPNSETDTFGFEAFDLPDE